MARIARPKDGPIPHATLFATPRLRARRMLPDDLRAFVGYRADPDVARYQNWSDYTLQQGLALIESMQGVDLGTPGHWSQIALERKTDAVLVGDLALHVHADDARQAEIGFTLAPASQGQGYATEALHAYLDWLFASQGLHRITAVTDSMNHPAAALLERVGMRREAHHLKNVWFKGNWGSEYVYAILAKEWNYRDASG